MAVTFFDSSLIYFCFMEHFLVYNQNLYFFTKLAVSYLLDKFVCLSLALKFPDVNLLTSWVINYLSWSWSVVTLFLASLIFVL